MRHSIRSKALIYSDLDSEWYKHWSKKLKQTESGRGDFELRSNKFWQNAAIAQSLYERGALLKGNKGLGFGVGIERLPALFASMDVAVMATDQDFHNDKASYWENGQLSHGANSLNNEGICGKRAFEENVSYQAVDMTRIPKNLNGKYDFLWSNCALGHLGSIEKSLEFIEKSLNCLKPGGYAVHTTEANILSDTDTLDSGDTVLFRQSDLLKLFKNLSNQGYIVEALNFELLHTPIDAQFTLLPKWGTRYSKILFNGYMATQIILIIHKPMKPATLLTRKLEVIKHSLFYHRNLGLMRQFKSRNTELKNLIENDEHNKQIALSDLSITPLKSTVSVKLKVGQQKKVKLVYRNNSPSGLFKTHGCFNGSDPIVVATSRPINKDSKLYSDTWYSKNRPTIEFNKHDKASKEIEYVQPNETFEVVFDIKAPNTKAKSYKEWFTLVKEGQGLIEGTEVELKIDLV